MQTKIIIKSLITNLFLALLKILGSVLSNSKTLMSDAIHCLSDMSTDIIGLVGSKLSNKKADKHHPFGHGKIEYLTSIFISFFIIGLGVTTIINAFSGKLKIPNIYALIVLIISIIIKFFLSSYLIKKGRELNSNILKSNGTESRYDTYSSLVALLFVSLSFIGKVNEIFIYCDLIGSLVMSIFTFKVGIEVLIKNVSSILGEVEEDKDKLNIIKDIVKRNDKILKIRRITLLKYGTYYNATIELIMKENETLKEIYKIEKKIKEDLKTSNLSIRYVTVNFKPKESHVNK